jgi:hypothetical protein
MRRWLLACLALLGGMLLNVALDLRSAALARPGNKPVQKSAARAAPRVGHPGSGRRGNSIGGANTGGAWSLACGSTKSSGNSIWMRRRFFLFLDALTPPTRAAA